MKEYCLTNGNGGYRKKTLVCGIVEATKDRLLSLGKHSCYALLEGRSVCVLDKEIGSILFPEFSKDQDFGAIPHYGFTIHEYFGSILYSGFWKRKDTGDFELWISKDEEIGSIRYSWSCTDEEIVATRYSDEFPPAGLLKPNQHPQSGF